MDEMHLVGIETAAPALSQTLLESRLYIPKDLGRPSTWLFEPEFLNLPGLPEMGIGLHHLWRSGLAGREPLAEASLVRMEMALRSEGTTTKLPHPPSYP